MSVHRCHVLSFSPAVNPSLTLIPSMSTPIYLLTGDDITFHCFDSMGNPPPTITWRLRENTLMDGEQGKASCHVTIMWLM